MQLYFVFYFLLVYSNLKSSSDLANKNAASTNDTTATATDENKKYAIKFSHVKITLYNI